MTCQHLVMISIHKINNSNKILIKAYSKLYLSMWHHYSCSTDKEFTYKWQHVQIIIQDVFFYSTSLASLSIFRKWFNLKIESSISFFQLSNLFIFVVWFVSSLCSLLLLFGEMSYNLFLVKTFPHNLYFLGNKKYTPIP